MDLEAIVVPKTLGEALRLLQARAGVSRDALAARAGVSTGAVSNYLGDASAPSAVVLRRITDTLADALGLDRNRLWVELGSFLEGSPKGRARHGGASEPGPGSLAAGAVAGAYAAYVHVELEPGTDAHEVATQAALIPGVTLAEEVEGPFGVIVRAEASDAQELDDRVVSVVHALHGVIRTITSPVLRL
jgi:transcriptional regulator with XRE-family HTH domain